MGAGQLERVLQGFAGGGKVQSAIKQASRRAAITARKAGAQEIRSMYTIKAGDLKSAAVIKPDALGTTIHIRGPEEPVTKYKATRRRKGILSRSKRAAALLFRGPSICLGGGLRPVKDGPDTQ